MSQYLPLTPVSDADENGNYSEALEFAIEHEKVTNIAITGPYGSGKSSIIDTFIEKKGDINCIKISLAEFGNTLVQDEKSEQGEPDVSEGSTTTKSSNRAIQNTNYSKQLPLIERSILQQLFYQIPSESIGYSRFKTIKHFSEANLNSLSAIFLLLILLVIAFFNLPTLYELSDYIVTSNKMSQTVKWVIYGGFVFVAVCVLYVIIKEITKVISRFKIASFNLNSIGEIKLENKEDSLLNIYLDEIVYFFRQQHIDAVFFEDLDRFKGVDIQIFTKLRELNHLLNNAVAIDYTVNFVFALKDDMFHSNEERTKFFDFVIPVIPYVNKSNSANILKTSLYESHPEFKEEIDEDFVEKIAYFVGDMRTLINIQNEFSLYLKNLTGRLEKNPELLIPSNLLGFMVYKNVYPQDFALLNKGQGKVIRVLNSKNKLVSETVNELKSKIDKKKKEIEAIKNENLFSLEQIRLLTNLKITNLVGDGQQRTHVEVDSETVTIQQFLADTESTEKYLSSNLLFTSRNTNNYNQVFHRKPIASSMMSEISNWYEHKKSLLEAKTDIGKINNQIVQIENEMSSVRQMSLGKLLLSYPSLSDCFRKELSGENDQLLLYLLEHEYIDDNYNFYLTYHHDGGLTINDMKFVHDVKKQLPPDYLYPLNNPKKVAEKLGERFLSGPCALNINLVTFLVEEQQGDWLKKSELYYLILNSFENVEKELCDFLIKFLHVSPVSDLLIHFMALHWNEFWDFVTFEMFNDEEKEQILFHLLKNTNVKVIQNLDESGNLSAFLKEKDILQFIKASKSDQKLHQLLCLLDIRFDIDNLKSVSKENRDFKRLVVNQLYEITPKVIDLILKNYCELNDLGDYENKHLSTILESDCHEFSSHIKNNLNDYFNNIYQHLEEQEEPQEFIEKILNYSDETLSQSNKEMFLLHQKDRVKGLDNISENWYEFLFENSLIEPCWPNVIVAYSVNNKLGSALLNYLNETENAINLSEKKLNPELGDEPVIKSLSIAIVKSNQLSDKSYDYLLKSIYWWYKSLDISNLNNAKAKSLIRHEKIRYTEENMNSISQHHPSLKVSLIGTDFKKFIDEYDPELILEEDLLELLESDNFSIEKKFTLINLEQGRIIESIDEFKQAIFALLTSNIGNLEINFDVFFALIKKLTSTKEKIISLNNQISYLSNAQIIDFMNHIGGNYQKVVENTRGMQYFDDTEQNKILFDELYRRKIVGKHFVLNENLRVPSKKTK